MISIVNYGMGNICSIQNALNYLRVENCVINSPEEIIRAEKLILPGVGSFAKAIENIRKLNILEPINIAVRKMGKPILGICLGMQLLADSGDEDGPTEGFGFIHGRVRRISVIDGLKLPHIGFNQVAVSSGERMLFKGLKESADFYFIHNYVFICESQQDVSSITKYGETFASSVENENVYGVQFHPEKSQGNGLALLKNYCSL